MKLRLEYSVNEYSDPPRPWCQAFILSGNRSLVGVSGDTFEEARENAIEKAKKILGFGDIPEPEEIEI